MSLITKGKSNIDKTDVQDGDTVGSYIISDSDQIISSTGQSLDVNVTTADLDIRDLDPSQDVVAIGDGTNQLEINADGSINVGLNPGSEVVVTDGNDTIAINVDGSINITDNGGSITVDAVDLDTRDLTPAQDGVLIYGSNDGTPNGTMLPVVNSVRLQILNSEDRDQAISYADFGTKNQRVTQIDYTSPDFPGVTARKTISYTLVGNRYRRDNITWSIV